MLFSTFDQMVIVSKIHGQPSYIYIFKIEDPISNGQDKQMHGQMDVKTVYPPQTQFARGGG